MLQVVSECFQNTNVTISPFWCFMFHDLPKFSNVYQLYLLILIVVVILCHRLPLLLYQQVISCWFDQQGTVSLKHQPLM